MGRKTMLTAVLVCFGITFAGTVAAQDSAKTPACSEPEYAEFDFWVGEWNVYTNDENRTFQGSNSITRHHKNCLIMENWTSAQGGDGRSMNYYDPVEDQWRLLWVA